MLMSFVVVVCPVGGNFIGAKWMVLIFNVYDTNNCVKILLPSVCVNVCAVYQK